jgi:DNA-binding Lrp family transcriptional regulator
VEAFLYVRTSAGTAAGSAARVAAEIMTKPGIRRAVAVIGAWDVLAIAEGVDMRAIAATVLGHVQPLDEVERTLTAPLVPSDQLGALGGGFGITRPPQLTPGDACFVHIKAQAGTVPALYERLGENEAIAGLAAIAGEFDLVAEIRGPWEVASGIILEQIQALPGILSTTTMIGVDYDGREEEDRDQFSAWS